MRPITEIAETIKAPFEEIQKTVNGTKNLTAIG